MIRPPPYRVVKNLVLSPVKCCNWISMAAWSDYLIVVLTGDLFRWSYRESTMVKFARSKPL
jgi:hypothetical protein